MRRLGLLIALLIVTAPVLAQTGTKISQMPPAPPAGNVTAGDIFPALRGTTSSGFVNYQEVMPLGSTTTPGLLQCGSGLNCAAGVISGASFPSMTNAAFQYLTNNGSVVNWSNPASLIDPRTYGASCVGSGATGGLTSLGQGILILTAGTAGTTGTYTSVPVTGGSGSGAVATFVVSGGGVTTVTITTPGSGYKQRDQISALTTNIGNVIGFTAQVASFAALQNPAYDGTHNDTAAFQTAVNMAQNTGQGVLVPNGCWISQVNVPQGVVMVGEGWSPAYGFDALGDTADASPVLYLIGGTTFGLHVGINPNNAFHGFEINDSQSGAFQNQICIGTDANSNGGAPRTWIDHMSFKNCHEGVGATGNSEYFPVSTYNDYGTSIYGIYGCASDLFSDHDQFDSSMTAGIYLNGCGGGEAMISNDRFEFIQYGIHDTDYNGITMSNNQFDRNSSAGILIDGSGGSMYISGGSMQGNGTTGTTGNDADIVLSRTTTAAANVHVQGVFFSSFAAGPHILDVTTSAADNTSVWFEKGSALNATTSGFAVYRNGQPATMKFDLEAMPFYDTTQPTFTLTGCSNSSVVGNGTTGSFVSGITGACAVMVTPYGTLSASQAQPHGYACGSFLDTTTTSNTVSWTQLSTTTTSAALAGTTSTGDVVSFSCTSY